MAGDDVVVGDDVALVETMTPEPRPGVLRERSKTCPR